VVYGLYEVSIFLVKQVEKTRKKKLQAEGLWFEDDEDEDVEAEDPLMKEFDEDEDAPEHGESVRVS